MGYYFAVLWDFYTAPQEPGYGYLSGLAIILLRKEGA
jgi:hypothetical protein